MIFKAVLVAINLSGQVLWEMPAIDFPSLEDCARYAKETAKEKSGPNGNWSWACPESPSQAVKSKGR